MKINLVTVGNKQPEWVNTAFKEYAKRLNQEISLHLIEVVAITRTKNLTGEKVKQKEALSIRAVIPKNNVVIALDENGKHFTSQSLSDKLSRYLADGQDICLIVGGADGLDKNIIQEASASWCLSALTLPHGIVRVMLAEQLYRAWTILKCHPYHRI